MRIRSDCFFLSCEGILDRNSAEILIGKKIEAQKLDAKSLSKDEYYQMDLIGLDVYLTDGTHIGKLIKIDCFGSADVFTVAGKNTVRFPFLKKLGLSVDNILKKITIDKERFWEVCCYED